MRDPIESGTKLNDRQLFNQFINGVGNAFGATKLGGSIDRTFLNCNFKERQITDAEQKVLEVIEYERQQAVIDRIKKRNKKRGINIANTKFLNMDSQEIYEDTQEMDQFSDKEMMNNDRSVTPNNFYLTEKINDFDHQQPRTAEKLTKSNNTTSMEQAQTQLNLPKIKKISPSFNRNISERGGGGSVRNGAINNLLQMLQSPKANTGYQQKLLHNNRVFNHFIDKNRSPRIGYSPNNLINNLRISLPKDNKQFDATGGSSIFDKNSASRNDRRFAKTTLIKPS